MIQGSKLITFFTSSSSSGAATGKAKHVRLRQPPVDAVAAADEHERYEDPDDDAGDANVGATHGEAHECPVRQ